ncbi:hypothetical protein DFP90_101723 [Aestuariispira insulae]|uniref:Uncharacterized protein n=2 Tax=Aestuariispira insulae TaxID=1461337 RepID=A0A3D9HWP2_9PROT|nr:hypothetical protein DFP90_101723 [Aestuariispira insulae]
MEPDAKKQASGLYGNWILSMRNKPSLTQKLVSLLGFLLVISGIIFFGFGFGKTQIYLVCLLWVAWLLASLFFRVVSTFVWGMIIFHPLLLKAPDRKMIVLRRVWFVGTGLSLLPLLLATNWASALGLFIMMDLLLALTWTSAQMNHAEMPGHEDEIRNAALLSGDPMALTFAARDPDSSSRSKEQPKGD